MVYDCIYFYWFAITFSLKVLLLLPLRPGDFSKGIRMWDPRSPWLPKGANNGNVESGNGNEKKCMGAAKAAMDEVGHLKMRCDKQ